MNTTIDIPRARETVKILERLNDHDGVRDYLEHVGRKDHVRVTVHRAVKPRFGRTIMRRVHDEITTPRRLAPSVLLADEARAMLGLKPKALAELLGWFGGELVSVTPNLRTTVGNDYVCDSLGKSASRPAVAEYMALSENAAGPAAGDTTLTGEITTNGLARVLATYAHTGAAILYTLAKTFTATGAFTAVQKEAIFNASSAGTMYVENTFTATALAINDQLTVTHTLNV